MVKFISSINILFEVTLVTKVAIRPLPKLLMSPFSIVTKFAHVTNVKAISGTTITNVYQCYQSHELYQSYQFYQ